MKYLALIAFVFLFSCEKPERCAICQSTIYYNGSTEGELLHDQRMVCGDELDFLDGRVMKVTEEDGAEYTSITITRCK